VRLAAVLAGTMMVGIGALTLVRLAGVKLTKLPVPGALTRAVSSGHRRAMRYSPGTRALSIGLLTTLIPCGWLYAFVITAAGTGHAWTGVLFMATFWLGTLPMLTMVGVGVRKLAAPLAAKLPAITASAIVIAGLYTIVARAGIVLQKPAHRDGTSAAELVREIKSIDESKLPCCTAPANSEGPATREFVK
jgi:sulfite exporter TauE/SafE